MVAGISRVDQAQEVMGLQLYGKGHIRECESGSSHLGLTVL